MTPLAVIDDSTILALIADTAFAKDIPCFHNKKDLLDNGGGGCGACARKRAAKKREAFVRIKTCLAALSPEKKQLLKQKLDAQQLRVVYAAPGGKTASVTF